MQIDPTRFYPQQAGINLSHLGFTSISETSEPLTSYLANNQSKGNVIAHLSLNLLSTNNPFIF